MDKSPKVRKLLEVKPSIISADRVGPGFPITDPIAKIHTIASSIEANENIPAVHQIRQFSLDSNAFIFIQCLHLLLQKSKTLESSLSVDGIPAFHVGPPLSLPPINERELMSFIRTTILHAILHLTLAANTARSYATFIRLSRPLLKRQKMSYFYIPRPPLEYTCYVPVQSLVPQQCYAPQAPEVYYQPPPQEYVYRPPPQTRVYQPPAQECYYQPPPQKYMYQPPAQTYEYMPPAQKYVYQPPLEKISDRDFAWRTLGGDARMFRELGIPGRDIRSPTLMGITLPTIP